MRTATLVGIVLLVIGIAAAAPQNPAARPVSPARWFPASTIGYAEITNPGPMASVLADWVEGSMVADYPLRMPSLNPSALNPSANAPAVPAATPRKPTWLPPVAMLLTREGVRDAARLGPMAWGAVGLNAQREPEDAYVVCLGESSLLSTWLRTQLAHENARAVEEVDGIGVYVSTESSPDMLYRLWRRANTMRQQQMPQPAGPRRPSGPQAPADEDQENVAYAILSDAIVVGTREGVRQILKGHEHPGQSLADTPAYKEASTSVAGGFFLFQPKSKRPPTLPGVWVQPTWIEALAPDSGYWTGQWDLQNNRLSLKAQPPANLATSFRRALAGNPVNQAILHFAPPDSVGVVAWNVDGSQAQLDGALFAADVFSADDSMAPSRRLRQVEQQGHLHVTPELDGKMSNVACVLSQRSPNGKPVITLVVESKSPEIAQQWIGDLIPKLVTADAAQPMAPTVKEVDGITVQLYDQGSGQNLCVGKAERFVVLGMDANQVVAALKSGTKQQGWPADANARQALKDSGGATLVGMARTWPALLSLQRLMAPDYDRLFAANRPGINGLPFAGPPNAGPAAVQVAPFPGGPGNRPVPEGPPSNANAPDVPTDPTWKKLVEASGEPLSFWIQPKGERWQIEARQNNPKRGLAFFIELWLTKNTVGDGMGPMLGRPTQPMPGTPPLPVPAGPAVPGQQRVPPPPKDK